MRGLHEQPVRRTCRTRATAVYAAQGATRMTETSMLAVGLIVAVSAALQASVGIGFAVLAAPLLAILAPELVPGPLLLLAVLLSMMTMARELRSVDVPQLSVAMIGRIAGTVVAGAVIALLPLAVFSSIFALMILAAIGMSLTRWHLLPTRLNLIVAGLLSGLMGTMTSVGSPPIALVYQNQPGPKVRATMGAFLMLGASFSLVTLAVVGRFTAAHAMTTLWLIAPVLLGFMASKFFVRHVDKRKGGIKPIVLGVSALAALVLLVKQVL
jgi:uncharacterized protein